MKLFTIAVEAALLLGCACSAAADALTPAGIWRGHAKFSSSVLGTDDPDAATASELTLSVTVYGEVAGAFPGTDCRVAGKAQPASPGSSIATLSVTISTCTNASYNGKYEGRLIPSKDGTAQFEIAGMIFDRALSSAARRNVVSSTLSR